MQSAGHGMAPPSLVSTLTPEHGELTIHQGNVQPTAHVVLDTAHEPSRMEDLQWAHLLHSSLHNPQPLQNQSQFRQPTSQPPCIPRSSHLVLEADLGSDDVGSPADHAEG